MFSNKKFYLIVHDVFYHSLEENIYFYHKIGLNALHAKLIKYIEIFLYYCLFDKILVWGTDDYKLLIKNNLLQRKVEIIPPIYSIKRKQSPANKYYLFVGSSLHKPNISSLKKSIVIFNNIRKIDKKIKLVVIGKWKDKISSKNVIYKGEVKNITRYYYNTSALLSPIEWGTGVKVKIIEAMAYGLPIITNNKGIRNLIVNMPDEKLNRKNKYYRIFKKYNVFLLKNNKNYYSSQFSAINILPLYQNIFI